MTRRYTRAELADYMRREANATRDTADLMAQQFGGCDDPLHPFMPVGDDQPFRDWVDFVDRVCRPLIDAETDHAAEQAAMALPLLHRRLSRDGPRPTHPR